MLPFPTLPIIGGAQVSPNDLSKPLSVPIGMRKSISIRPHLGQSKRLALFDVLQGKEGIKDHENEAFVTCPTWGKAFQGTDA